VQVQVQVLVIMHGGVRVQLQGRGGGAVRSGGVHLPVHLQAARRMCPYARAQPARHVHVSGRRAMSLEEGRSAGEGGGKSSAVPVGVQSHQRECYGLVSNSCVTPLDEQVAQLLRGRATWQGKLSLLFQSRRMPSRRPLLQAAQQAPLLPDGAPCPHVPGARVCYQPAGTYCHVYGR
jgi:hypothetical protein